MHINHKQFIQYIYLYAQVYKKVNLQTSIFQINKTNQYDGYKMYFFTIHMGTIQIYNDPERTDLVETLVTLLMVKPEPFDNCELTYVTPLVFY
jgi:hypothetical protein